MKKLLFWVVVSAIIMLALPWLAVTFVKGDAAMAVCFLLFYGIDPIYSVITGAIAGKDIRRLYLLPFVPAILYLVGVWTFFDPGESAFTGYAMIYFVLSILAVAISLLVERKRRR